MEYDYLIIGAGLTGLVLGERLTNQLGKKVLIIDKRSHIGGNCYDYKDKKTWITIHKYGPHVFHTKYKEVRDYLSQFTEREPFFYNVKAIIDSKVITLPFNLNSIYQVFSPELAKKYENLLVDRYGFGTRLVIKELLDSGNEDLKSLGYYVFKKVFEGYTKNQWGLNIDEVDPSIFYRIPIKLSRDNRAYSNKKYQGLPEFGTELAYPVEIKENLDILGGYKSESEKLGNVFFIGRLANYKYQDMDLTFKKALDFVNNII